MRVWGSGFRVPGLGKGAREWEVVVVRRCVGGLELRVDGLGFRV